MKYTQTQKEAIVSLVIEMINADHLVTLEELKESNLINHELEITDELFTVGYALDTDFAIKIVKEMSDEQKLNVGLLLTRIIDADEAVHDEFTLFNAICEKTGIDIVIHEREKTRQLTKKARSAQGDNPRIQ